MESGHFESEDDVLREAIATWSDASQGFKSFATWSARPTSRSPPAEPAHSTRSIPRVRSADVSPAREL